jgi:hypothetical protein
VEVMMKMLKGQPIETQFLSTELVERKSTAPPKAKSPKAGSSA